MSDSGALGVGIITIPNPHTDPITMAQSAVDVHRGFVAQVDPEVKRLTGKLERMQADLDSLVDTIEEVKAGKAVHQANLNAALEVLADAREADPEGAAVHDGRRAQNIAQQRAELAQRLADLNNQEG